MKHSFLRFVLLIAAAMVTFASCEKEEVTEELVLDGKWEIITGSDYSYSNVNYTDASELFTARYYAMSIIYGERARYDDSRKYCKTVATFDNGTLTVEYTVPDKDPETGELVLHEMKGVHSYTFDGCYLIIDGWDYEELRYCSHSGGAYFSRFIMKNTDPKVKYGHNDNYNEDAFYFSDYWNGNAFYDGTITIKAGTTLVLAIFERLFPYYYGMERVNFENCELKIVNKPDAESVSIVRTEMDDNCARITVKGEGAGTSTGMKVELWTKDSKPKLLYRKSITIDVE